MNYIQNHFSRFILVSLFTCFYSFASGQSESGYKGGDKQLIMYLERNLLRELNDTSSYFFTITLLCFDQNGRLDSVKFMNSGKSIYKEYITKLVFDTRDSWESSTTRNLTVLIPVEIIKLNDSFDPEFPHFSLRMISSEYQEIFKNKSSLRSILLPPVIITILPAMSQISSASSDTEKLMKLEYDWLMAEFKLDTATISAMMDENFIAIGLKSISNKQQELDGIYESISQRMKNGHVVDSLYLDDMNIRVFENTAVVTFISVTKGHIKNVPFENRRTRMYDVWIKKNGQWKAISSQVSPIR